MEWEAGSHLSDFNVEDANSNTVLVDYTGNGSDSTIDSTEWVGGSGGSYPYSGGPYTVDVVTLGGPALRSRSGERPGVLRVAILYVARATVRGAHRGGNRRNSQRRRLLDRLYDGRRELLWQCRGRRRGFEPHPECADQPHSPRPMVGAIGWSPRTEGPSQRVTPSSTARWGYHLNAQVVDIAPTPDGHGYWLVPSDGGIFSFGDAQVDGSTGNLHLNQPVVGMASTPDGHGYWLVARDGGIFAFGDAPFYGSTGNVDLNKPVNGMAATSDGLGYWCVASDGGIFAYGDADFEGSMGGTTLNAPIVGMAPDNASGGYWLLGSDGGVFSFDAPFDGAR